jgi:ribosome-binding protein aMBF1 (putative translation factor)
MDSTPDHEYQFIYQEFDIVREQLAAAPGKTTTEHSGGAEKVMIVTPTQEASFAIRMQEARINKRMTVHHLAEQCALSTKDIINYETGAEVPSVVEVKKIEAVLNMLG